MSEPAIRFATKIAIVIRSDLETWQKLNVAAFLASGVAATYPEQDTKMQPARPITR